MSEAFDDRTISELQKIRRANNAVLACATILNEDHQNDGCVPNGGQAWIRLNSQQKGGLVFAMEACAEMIDGLFTNYFEDRGIRWHDDHLPHIKEESAAMAALDSGEIDYPEFSRRVDGIGQQH